MQSFVLYGISVPYERFEYEDIEAYGPGGAKARETGVVVIYDGMSGGDTYIGYLIDSADEYAQFEAPVIFDPTPKPEWNAALAKVFTDLKIEDAPAPPRYIVLTHYT